MQSIQTFALSKLLQHFSNKFCTVIKIKYSLWFEPKCAPQIQDGGRPPCWKNEKNCYNL